MTEQNWTADQIRTEIKALIARVTEREPDEISDSAHYIEELDIDSLMAMELMIAIDRKFSIDVPEEEFRKASNVDDSTAMVEQFLAAKSIPAGA
jgi:acyl carrier protein